MKKNERWYCAKCNALNGPGRNTCYSCGALREKGIPASSEDGKQIEKEIKARSEEKARGPKIILSTTPSLEGYKVVETLEIVTAECVYGINIFRDFFMGVRNFFGGRTESAQKVLRDARKNCLNELKKEAVIVGANAVIGVSLDYSEFSGKDKSMLFLVATGTAVIVEETEGQ